MPHSPGGAPALRRLLVVDDNEDAANSLAMLLGLTGRETRVAFRAAEALDVAREFRPEVALLDISLPDMNGFELARRFRADQALHGVRLIALTGYGRAEDKEQTTAAGFFAHLVKPVALADIERVLADPNA